MPLAPAAQQAWQTLADKLRRWEAPRRSAAAATPTSLPTAARLAETALPPGVRLSTGCRPLDERLPERGLRLGSLVDWLAPVRGGGAGTFAWNCAWRACGRARWLVVVDRSDRFSFAPGSPASQASPAHAASGAADPRAAHPGRRPQSRFHPPGGGGDPSRWLVVRPEDDLQAHWALHQALSCPAVGAVLGWDWNFDENGWRRLQRAAERSGVLGVFVGGSSARRSGAWADHRFWIEPRPSLPRFPQSAFGGRAGSPTSQAGRRGREEGIEEEATAGDARRFRIEILRCRGQATHPGLEVERRHGADLVRPLPPLAVAAAPRRAAGA